MNPMQFLPLVTAALAVLAFPLAAQQQTPLHPGFGSHWFQGKAELNTYKLEQSRYGEMRTGKAIVMFVTEDFDPDALVKDEDGRGPSVGILKMNQIRRFTTGIYDYSMMLSTFTRRRPGDSGPRTLKTTTSVQDWCGHAWLQLDAEGSDYRFTGHSYFERENQESGEIDGDVLLEDELLTRLRLGPDALPTGEVTAVPSSFDSRLGHRPLRAERAMAVRQAAEDGVMTYTLAFVKLGREVTVRYEAAFPHKILGWEERIGDRVTARATLQASRMEAYWSRNREADTPLRAPLGLPPGDL